MKQEVVCSSCPKKFDRIKDKNKLKRIRKIWICFECYKKKRAEHREYLKRDVCGIRKRVDILREDKERKQRELELPTIKGSKNTHLQTRTNHYKGIWLTSVEKQILYNKYKHLGSDLANTKTKQITIHFNDMVERWKGKELDDKEISLRFKEEWAKMIIQENGK